MGESMVGGAGVETRGPVRDYDAGVWHAFVPGVGAGEAYGYRATGPYDPARGVRCNPAKLLLDPYARAFSGGVTFGPEVLDDGGLLLDDDFLVLVNAWWEPLEFVLPVTRAQAAWHVEIDSYDATPSASSVARRAGDSITVCPRSVLVLACPDQTERPRPTPHPSPPSPT